MKWQRVSMSRFLLQVSHTFCRDFLQLLRTDVSNGELGSSNTLVKGLQRVSEGQVSNVSLACVGLQCTSSHSVCEN